MEVNAKLWASIEFALLNNNKFLKYMFDIDYPETPINSALYIERLLMLDLPKCVQNMHYIFESEKIIRYCSLNKLPIILTRNTMLYVTKKLAKSYISRLKGAYLQT